VSPRPLLTVVVPTFDDTRGLQLSLPSVLAQSFGEFELLVVDDGSTDGSRELVQAIDDPRLRYFHQERQGVSAARNRGLREARGEAVVFLDSDDQALPDWLACLAEGFAEPDAGVVTAGIVVEEHGGSRHVVLPGLINPLLAGQKLCFFAGAMAARRTLLDAVGGYAPGLGYAENEELSLRLVPACVARGLRVVAIDRPLVVYHRNPQPWWRDPRRFTLMRDSAEYILEHHGDRLLEQFPRGYSNHRGVAAVNAARLGDFRAARRHLALSLRATPRRWKNYLRWALTLVPPVARRFWTRGRRRPS
jgi:cellulose synthase/poly-beta-1,6-N-acetylglucosamine synthase-like glycosyltransferase